MSDSLDESMLAELREIMEDDFPLLLETYLTESQKQYAAVKESWSDGDLPLLNRCAHSLKGACSNIGAAPMAQICLQIEKAAADQRTADIPAYISALETEIAVVRQRLSEQLT